MGNMQNVVCGRILPVITIAEALQIMQRRKREEGEGRWPIWLNFGSKNDRYFRELRSKLGTFKSKLGKLKLMGNMPNVKFKGGTYCYW